jgi:catechol 2,3-dioxygenase-like lactoylglutathione lyase family enzyme
VPETGSRFKNGNTFEKITRGELRHLIKHRGLRHLALKVSDVERAVQFYSRVFGMRMLWQPDPDNAYLSSGCDNLALHRANHGDVDAQTLDHFGFIAPSIADVEASWMWAQSEHLEIAHPLKHHRDGSVSFYISDPDGNVIQVLYKQGLSPQTLS